MPKVSIIVPIHNTEGYLRKCIESIRNQTLKEIEIILVDDGSTDASGVICDEYAICDSRIKVIHKSNEGLSCARNDGIDAACAPYILFVDSDDWVESTICEKTYDAAICNDADLVMFLHKRIRTDGSEGRKDLTDIKDGIISEAEALDINCHVCCGAWMNLYLKELFQTIRFPAGKLYEDTGTTHKLIHEAKRIFFLKECLYFHLIDRSGSIVDMNANHPDRQEMNVNRLADLHSWGYDHLIREAAFSYFITHGQDEAGCIDEIIKGIQGIPGEFDWKNKLMLMIYHMSPSIFHDICKISGKRKHSE